MKNHFYRAENHVVIEAKGQRILLDVEDFHDIAAKSSWCLNGSGYATGNFMGKSSLLHRLIMKASPGEIIDHINGNRLDNRRHNLRSTTQTTNNHNRHSGRLPKNIVKSYRTGKFMVIFEQARKKVQFGQFKTLPPAVALARKVREHLRNGEAIKDFIWQYKSKPKYVYKNGSQWMVAFRVKDRFTYFMRSPNRETAEREAPKILDRIKSGEPVESIRASYLS